jgi:hypothetical protein
MQDILGARQNQTNTISNATNVKQRIINKASFFALPLFEP